MKKLLFIPFCLSVVMVSAQSISRKVVFTKGQQMERVAAIKMSMGMEMMGQSIEIVNTNNLTSLIEVQNATGKDYALSSTVKRVVAGMSGMGQEVSYDTEKKEGSAPSEMTKKMDEMVGSRHNVVLDAKGVVTANDSDTSKDLSNFTSFLGSDGGLANSVNKVGSIYDLVGNLPEKPVKVGDSWTDSVVTAKGKTVSNYKVLEIKADEAIIGVDQTVAQTMQTENNGMTIDMTMQGTSKGQYWMEAATGIVKKRSSALDATGTMEVAGQSIPFTMKLSVEEGVTKK